MAMGQTAVKVILTCAIILGVNEVSKKDVLFSAILVSIPLISVLSMMWMHHDGTETKKIAQFGRDVFWLVLPSLLLFIVMPLMIDRGIGFWTSLGTGIFITACAYLVIIYMLGETGISNQ